MRAVRYLRVACEFVYEAGMETAAVLQVEPDGSAPVTVTREEWSGEPDVSRHSYTDIYGNRCQRLAIPEGPSTLRFEARVTVPDATEDVDVDAAELPASALPDDVLMYTLPSRYVVPDVLGDEAWDLFSGLKPGYGRVQAICDHVNSSIRFAYGTTTSISSAADVREAGVGVCRDFAHLALTYCRALSIPARYVFGYLPDMDVEPLPEPMDFAAWMEVYLDGKWWTFDPRNNRARKGRVVVGRGRDAVDVAMVTTFGGPQLKKMTVWADEVEP